MKKINIPKIMGHRGVAGIAPENTLGGFRKAAELGIGWVELDVTLLGDGTAVVNHDASIDRCSDQQGLLQALTKQDLASINNAAQFPHWPHAEPLPTLTEVLKLLMDLKLGLNLEIKAHSIPPEVLVQEIEKVLSACAFPCEQLIISSFSMPVLAECERQIPAAPRGVLFDEVPDDWLEQAKAIGAYSVHCNWQQLSYQTAQAIKGENYPLICWTANEPDFVSSLWFWGVDAIISDTPHLFL